MRLVNINQMPPNAFVARSIYTSSGSMLVKEKTPVTDKVISILEKQDIRSIYITDEVTESIKEEMNLDDSFDLKDVIDPVLRRKFNLSLKESITGFKKAKGLSNFSTEGQNLLNKVDEIAQTIVSELLLSKDRKISLVDVKHLDIYDYQHAVNTAILSTIVGLSFGFSERELMYMAQASLLMNISNELLSPLLAGKGDDLSEEDFNIIKSHPELSRQLLNDNTLANAHVKNIVLKHHERMNGSGYPSGLKSSEIDKYTKIVMIADVYDAMTSDRPYRKAYTPNEALEYIMGPSNLFDPDSAYAFSRHILPYPPGELVELSGGSTALVIETNEHMPLRPVVRVIMGINRNEIVDLKERRNIVINRKAIIY